MLRLSRTQETAFGLGALSDDELLRRLSELVGRSRRVESDVVAHIAEVDERRLYRREAAPSMFAYCTERLHLSEQEAYLRITVARAARVHPILLGMLADGRLHLSGIAKLAPHLTPETRDDLLARAVHRSKRQIEELVAELAPVADAPPLIRKLPERRGSADGASPSSVGADGPRLELGPDRAPAAPLVTPGRPAAIQPTAPARYKIQFTAGAALREKLERLVALMRTTVPDGDLATILEEAITEKLARLESRRFGRTKAPRKELKEAETASSASRYVPAPVRGVVDERDGGRCRYVSHDGHPCSGRAWLEFHHSQTHARGGDRAPENIQLMCRAHNVYLAENDFGDKVMSRYRRRPTG